MGCLGSFIIDRNGTELEYSTESQNSYNLSKAVRNSNVFDNLGIHNTHVGTYEDCISNAIVMLQSHGFEIQKYNFIIGDITVEKSKQLYIEDKK